MKIVRIASVVLALHLILLAFFFYKPPSNYFVVICLSTVIVWSAAFSFRKKRRAGIIVGLLVQLAIQQFAFHAWLPEQTSVWWPLVQFLSLQYVLALRLGNSPDDA